ncbi:MAG: HAD family phosphatase [Candidatus Undinarchaeales archaeon]|jgi:HAD superfamily hydrolase (TIGR01509 family)|nr:HAD family phosphatase [Candidatus Undinarchaeales archaeon]
MDNSDKAVIFDMDGVIVYTLDHHYAAWTELLAKQNIEFSRTEFNNLIGQSSQAFIQSLRIKGLKGPENNLVEEKDKLYLEKFKDKAPPLVDGFLQLIDDIKDADFKTAIATSEPINIMNAVMLEYALLNKFDVFVTSDDVKNLKPDPEIYLLAVDKLNVPSQNCMVFEDSLSGVTAAKSADMYCIALTTSYSDEELEKAGADKIIKDFTEINLGEILDALD